MTTTIEFQREMTFEYGKVETVAPQIRRIIAPNSGPYTLYGTATFIIGSGKVAVIDPGPHDPAHIQALIDGLGGEEVSHTVVTHTHRDHSPGAALLKDKTGAPTYAFGPHGAGRETRGGNANGVEEGGDLDFKPDHEIRDGDAIEGGDWRLDCVFTPGHSSNHMAYALGNALFCGDAVMAWSTAVIAPPDGHLASYIHTLKRLIDRKDEIYWPTHGPPIKKPQAFVKDYLAHRYDREAQIVESLKRSAKTIPDIVIDIYKGLDPRLHGAAGGSVRAHLDFLVERGLVTASTDDEPIFTLD